VLQARSKYRTSVKRGRGAFVLVVGKVDNVYKIQKLISEFYHPDRSLEQRKVKHAPQPRSSISR
jgi:hypothetical protein